MNKKLISISVIAAVLAVGSLAAPAQALSTSTCGRVQIYQNGTVGPVLCPNGHPNARVLKYLRANTPHMMALGAKARWAQIQYAACADAPNSTLPMLGDAYTYLYARYNWRGRNVSPATFDRRIIDGGALQYC